MATKPTKRGGKREGAGRKSGSNTTRISAIRSRIRALEIVGAPDAEIKETVSAEFSNGEATLTPKDVEKHQKWVHKNARRAAQEDGTDYFSWLLSEAVENLAMLKGQEDARGVTGQLKAIAELVGAEAPKRVDISDSRLADAWAITVSDDDLDSLDCSR